MDVLILKCKSYCFYYFELWYQVAPLEMIIHPKKIHMNTKDANRFFFLDLLFYIF